MASHGRRGVSAVVLGSETVKVLTHSKVPYSCIVEGVLVLCRAVAPSSVEHGRGRAISGRRSDLKHRMALTTAYAAGLRVSEVVRLKIADIDSARMLLRVEQGKGGKDRYVMLSPRLLAMLRRYWRAESPVIGCFPATTKAGPSIPACCRARAERLVPFQQASTDHSRAAIEGALVRKSGGDE